ncbi:MAG: carotenoid biosynthesis protein [Planctomycetaceae bacterium]
MKRIPSLPIVLLVAHLAALVFGLVGLLIMLPNPDLWAHDPRAVRVFDWSMENAGATHIVFGALAMLVAGWKLIGARKTLLFLAVSFSFSLGFELFGTGTGWPFGNYAYTDFLGAKVLGHVPWTIPLSWFYMGLASYLIGVVLANRFRPGQSGLWSVLIGAWLLTAWDLVLDPAMAHESLRVQFWVWDETGPYFGMPLKNFAGWALTGLVFMALSRLAWREDVRVEQDQLQIPAIVYAANMLFAMVISAAVGLWTPIVIAIVVAAIPVALSSRTGWRSFSPQPRGAGHG